MKWISVNDSLPNEGTSYLLYWEDRKVTVINYEKDVTTYAFSKWNGHNATHWMPLPKPPKQVKLRR